MTKVTYIGNQPKKQSKHIKLVQYYASINKVNESSEGFARCDLVKRNVNDGFDLIICHDIKGSIGVPYLGYWNDGTTSNPDTICTVLGEDVVKPKGKGIEFVKYLSPSTMSFIDGVANPEDFENIEVVLINFTKSGLSLFLAYDDDRENGGTYIGHLNDGFVE